MKQVGYIWICIVVGLLTLQPTLLAHFCEGKLSEIAYPLTHQPSSCCTDEMPSETTHHTALEATSCCHNQIYTLHTAPGLQTTGLSWVVALATIITFVFYNCLTFLTAIGRHPLPPFSPPSLAKNHGLGVLRRLCIYRI